MDRLKQLEEKSRRSHSFGPEEMEECWLEYAKLCRDEIAIYDFMLENGIGCNNVDLWLGRAKYFEANRDFANVLHTLKQARLVPEIRTYSLIQVSDPKCSLIEEYESQLEAHLEVITAIFTPSKRNMRESEISSALNNKHRKIGSMIVYVDRDCRSNYRLENLVDHYNKHCQRDMELERQRFEEQQSKKSLSWISDRWEQIQYLASQQIRQLRPSGIPANRLRVSENVNSNNQESKTQTPNKKLERLRERDSAEILRESFIKRKSQLIRRDNNSPRFNSNAAPSSHKRQSRIRNEEEAAPIEKCRSESLFLQSECIFSFRKPFCKISSQSLDITFQNPNEIARIEGNSDVLSCELEVRDQNMLHNVIKESQTARYEPEIIDLINTSAIDSQQENRGENQRGFQRQHQGARIPLSTLRFEEVVEPDMFNQVFLADVSPLSEDSLRGLEAMLDIDTSSQTPSEKRMCVDSLGFRRPYDPQDMSERKDRPSLLPEIREELPVSDTKLISSKRVSRTQNI